MGKTRDLLKKIEHTKENSCKDGHTKGQKWQGPNRRRRNEEEVTRIHIRLYKKDHNDPDNYDGMVTQLEPDIVKCEDKWVLRSTTMKKASGCDEIPAELFQILKDDTVKVLHSICQQIWKTQQWPQDCKRSVFIPIPKKGNAKEYSNMLAR